MWLLGYVFFFFELGDINSFSFAAPAIRTSWNLSISAIGFITSATFVGMFVGATTGGWFSDRVGRKRALVITTVWYAGFSLLNALVWEPIGCPVPACRRRDSVRAGNPSRLSSDRRTLRRSSSPGAPHIRATLSTALPDLALCRVSKPGRTTRHANIKAGDGLRFALESLLARWIGREVRGQNLDRDGALQPGIARDIPRPCRLRRAVTESHTARVSFLLQALSV